MYGWTLFFLVLAVGIIVVANVIVRYDTYFPGGRNTKTKKRT